MCKKIYYSPKTSYVFISAKDEICCANTAKRYFKRKRVRNYHEVSEDIVNFADKLKKVKLS